MIDALWEIPTAIATRPFFGAVRAFFRRGSVRWFERHPEEARRWRALTAAFVERPFALTSIVCTAPRWNPHAVIATVGPLAAHSSIEIDRSAADLSAGKWTIVLYDFPGARTLDRIGSGDDRTAFPVAPGRYTLALRYYRWAAEVAFPAVRADGAPAVEEIASPGGVDDLYRVLPRKRRLLYRILHHHVYAVLRFRRYLPESLVRREYLPVGNPETEFRYGAVRAGERIELDLEGETRDVYFTLYGRDSFPLRWYRIEAGRHVSEPAEESGFWLVRLV